MSTVKAWRDTVVIPTYEVFDPEKYPVFIEKRVYQASSGAVYPHPVIEKISDTAVDKEWQVIYIENAYIKLTNQINKRNALASNKIDQMTRDANTEIQKHITQIVISATVNILEKKLNDKEKQNLINQSVNELGSALKN